MGMGKVFKYEEKSYQLTQVQLFMLIANALKILVATLDIHYSNEDLIGLH